jgi:hypothetical protein
MKAFWDRVIAMRQKGICDVDIDDVEPECEVELN